MKTVAIIQARMGSRRLPGKVLKPLAGKPMLDVLVQRLRGAQAVDAIVVATSVLSRDDAIAEHVEANDNYEGVSVFRGSEDDVLDRYYWAAKAAQADVVLRVTADNPLFDAPTADRVISEVHRGNDYASNNLERSYPHGIDLEAFTFDALRRAHEQADDAQDREHVTPYIRRSSQQFKLCNVAWERDLSDVRLTVDTLEDYQRMRAIFGCHDLTARFTEVIDSL